MWLLILFTIYVILTFKSIKRICKGEFYPDMEEFKEAITLNTISFHIVTVAMSAFLLSFYFYASIAVQNDAFYYMSVAQCIFCIMSCFKTMEMITNISTNKTHKFTHPVLQILVVFYDVVYGYVFVGLGGLNNLF